VCEHFASYGFTSPTKEGMLWIVFSPEKSDGFSRVRTRDLGDLWNTE
jgi:hypothetical protein